MEGLSRSRSTAGTKVTGYQTTLATLRPITEGRPTCQGWGWPDGHTTGATSSSSPSVPVAEPWINLELVAGISSRLAQWERQGLPSSRRNPCDHSPYSSDPGVTRQAEWTTS